MRLGKRLLMACALAALPGVASATTFIAGTPGRLIDGSGTVAAAAASQTVFAANPYRAFLTCQNPISATEPLFVNFNAAASTTGGSVELAAGGSVTFADAFIPNGEVNVTAVTAGHRFMCKQGGAQ
jgi:hypothetical protein